MEARDNKAKPHRRKGRRWAIWSGAFVASLVIVILGFASLGRAVSAPDWVRRDVEVRLAEALPGFRVWFGDVQVALDRDGTTRVILLDVDVETAQGADVATLSDVEIGLASMPLIQGSAELKSLNITGAFVTLRRDRDGILGLALGDAFSGDGKTPDLPTLVSRVDTLLQDPRLAALREVEADALTLRYEDARARRGWTVDGGRLVLTRDGNLLRASGDFALLGGGATATTLQVNADSLIGDNALNFGFTLQDMPSQDIATQGPALAWLGALRAPISGALRAEMRADGGLGPLSASLQIDEGALQPDLDTPPIKFTGASSYFTYIPDQNSIVFTELSVDSALGRALAEGKATLSELTNGVPAEMVGQFTILSLETRDTSVIPEPLVIDHTEVDLRLKLDPFVLDVGRLWVDDPDMPVRLSGRLTADTAEWNYALDGQFGRVTNARLKQVWPEALAPRTRKWVADNVLEAVVTSGKFALRSQHDTRRPIASLSATFEDAEISYARNLPVIRDGSGTLELNRDRLVVRALGGHMTPPQGGEIKIAGSKFVIPEIRQRPARGELDLSGDASIEAVLSYLDSPKLEILTKAKRQVDMLAGRIKLDGSLNLPLQKGIKLADLGFDLRGRASAVRSDTLVPGRVLEANALDVKLTNRFLKAEGRATLDGVIFNGSWQMPLPETPGEPIAGSVVDGVVTLSDAAARAIGVALPRGTVSGSGPANLRVDIPRGDAPRFELSSRLSGVGLSIPQIGWRLPQAGTGNLQVAGVLDKPARINAISLDAAGLRTSGDVTLNSDGSLNRISLDRVRLAGWLDAPVVLTGRGTGAPLGVRISGGSVDLRNAPFGKGAQTPSSGATTPLALALDRLQISEGIVINDFRADLRSGGGLNGSFTGTLGGSAPIVGQAVSQPSGTAFRVTSGDAGRVLRAAGILRNVSGGNMVLTLVPVAGQPGSYDGALDVGNTRLRDAPGIASLLDAISIVGLLDQLEGPGILFSQVEARFRLTPQRLILTRSSATGPSMGISLDGIYNLASGTLDMQGVLSPIFFLNGIGSIFTRKGEGLIGFNFNLTGRASDPRVAVNPLSVFTPGMFREIFRRPPPQPSQ